VFVDSDAQTWSINPALLSDELEVRARSSTVPKACVVVDLYGQCADYGAITPILDEYGVTLVQDAAEALGATYRGQQAGTFGRAGILSFNGNKIITASSGGMLLTADPALADRARYLATQARQGTEEYEHAEVGFNYRLSNVLAALGRAQLTTLSDRIVRRTQIRERYVDALSSVPGISFQPVAGYGQPNNWLTCILIDRDEAGFDSQVLRRHLEADDIESRPLWKPLHLQPAFAGAQGRIDGTSEALWRGGLCLPSGSSMSDADLDRVIGRILSLT
jgi:dTDP-4-amino-4,6-dideoxygalactose transaminase